MSREKKPASWSEVARTEMVLPNDTNTLDNLMGGRVMHWMDIAAAISSQKHSNRTVVTASVDNVSFSKPIRRGNVVTLRSKVTRAFKTSMEVHIEVWAEDIPKEEKFKSNEAFFTFVAMDQHSNPVIIPEVIPETEEEKELHDSALRRREMRLYQAGRLNPEDATELKEIFNI